MQGTTWTRLPDRKAAGTWQMAADEWMLGRAQAGECLFRVYEFDTPTVSIGYFQPSGAVKSDSRLANLPWTRRQTGGDLLVHDRELTYAIAGPAGALGPARDLSCRVHRSVADWLQVNGMDVGCQSEPGKISMAGAPGGVLCFLHPAAGDIVFRGCKVMGSAQRKRHGAVLQHGSLLMGTSPAAPWLPGLKDLGGAVTGLNSEGLARSIEKALGAISLPGNWDDGAEAEIRSLEESRYRNPEWNEAR